MSAQERVKTRDKKDKKEVPKKNSLSEPFVMSASNWKRAINWIPADFITKQKAFLILGEADRYFKDALPNIYPDIPVWTETEFKASGDKIRPCVIINPEWTDIVPSIGSASLESRLPDLEQRCSGAIVLGSPKEDAAMTLIHKLRPSLKPYGGKSIVATGQKITCLEF